MKKTILLSAVLAAGAAFATGTDVESGNAVGALDVSLANTNSTLIAVPFVGYENGAVKVEEMVKTSDLAQGSKLYVPNGTAGGYDTWTLDKDGKWAPDTKVTISAIETTVGESLGQDKATANRGDSFWLEPKFKTGTTGTVFLLGQGDAAQGSSTIAENTWNLIGNTATVEKTLPASGWISGEKVCIPNAAGGLDTYTFRNSQWRKEGVTDRTAVATITIQPGRGFWFLSKGTTSIAW